MLMVPQQDIIMITRVVVCISCNSNMPLTFYVLLIACHESKGSASLF